MNKGYKFKLKPNKGQKEIRSEFTELRKNIV